MDPQPAQPIQEKPKSKKPLIIGAVALAVIVLVGGYFLAQTVIKDTKTQASEYREGLAKEQVSIAVLDGSGGTYPSIVFDVDSLSMNSNVYEGLTIIRGGRVSPGLAESWSNPDATTWRINLRKNVLFHSGDRLTAKDVKYTIEEAKKNEDWVNNFIAVRVDSVTIVDDLTLDIKTQNPDATLLHWLVWVMILSEDQVKRDGIEKAVGTGPYQWDSVDRKEPMLKANTGYWGGAPKVKNLRYKAYADDKALIDGLSKNEVDIGVIQDRTSAGVLTEKGIRLVSARIGDINLLAFDFTNAKTKYVDKEQNPFLNSKVRKAIMLTLDIPDILKKSDRQGSAITQIGNSDLVGFDSTLSRPTLDREQAKKLLAEAGFPAGFTVTLDFSASAKDFCEILKDQLAEIGITVNLNPIVNFNDFFDKIAGKNADSSFYYMSYVPDTLDAFDLINSFVHTSDKKGNGFNNFRGYSNSELDKLLDEAAMTFDTKERVEKTKKIQKLVMEELPVIPLSARIATYPIRDEVGFKPAPLGFIFGVELSGREKIVVSN